MADITEIESELKKAEGPEKLDLLLQIIGAFPPTEAQPCLAFCAEADALAIELEDTHVRVRVLIRKGSCYLADHQFVDAIESLQLAIELGKPLNVISDLGEAYRLLSVAYGHIHDHEQALDAGLQLLRLAEASNDDKLQCNALNNIGVIHGMVGRFDDALGYFLRSLKISREHEDLSSIAYTLNNIGMVHEHRQDWEQARSCFQESLEIKLQIDDRTVGSSYNNLGNTYSALGDNETALRCFEKGLEWERQHGDQITLCRLLMNLGSLLTEQDAFERAIGFFEEAEKIGKKLDNRLLLSGAYGRLADLYERLGNYTMVVKYLRVKERVSRELYNERTGVRLSALRAEYELEKKARETEIYRLKNIELARANDTIQQQHDALEEAYRQMALQARTDPLTQLSNRRDFIERFEQERSRVQRGAKPFVLALTDIDLFKQLNDQYGHDCGDFVLKHVANVLRDSLRRQDHLARWGGEEFILLLPEIDLKQGQHIAERIRERVAGLHLDFNGFRLGVTLTFGVCRFDLDWDMDQCVKQADTALYQGKREGRNRVVVI